MLRKGSHFLLFPVFVLNHTSRQAFLSPDIMQLQLLSQAVVALYLAHGPWRVADVNMQLFLSEWFETGDLTFSVLPEK